MKGKLDQILSEAHGSLHGEDGSTYLAQDPYDSTQVIVKKKPGKKPKDWKMPEKQQKSADSFKNAQAEASRRYHDPVLRAQYEADFEAFKKEQKKHQKTVMMYNGSKIAGLWDYVRARVREEI